MTHCSPDFPTHETFLTSKSETDKKMLASWVPLPPKQPSLYNFPKAAVLQERMET